MKHCEFEISQFVDGELTGEGKNELFRHLSECSECQKVFSEYLELKEKSKDFCAGKISKEISKKAFTLNPTVPERKRLFYRTAFYISSAAALLLLFFTVTLKPRPEVITKTVNNIDTVFVLKEKIIYKAALQAYRKSVDNRENDKKAYVEYLLTLPEQQMQIVAAPNNLSGESL